jgi:urea transporter
MTVAGGNVAGAAVGRVTDRWANLAETNPGVGAVDTLLRGVGQVMFQNNPITGLLFLVGIFINSYKFGLFALLGVAVSTATAYLLGADRTLIRNGLFGFNGVLTGIALGFFLQFDGLLVAYIIVGAAVSTIVMMALADLLANWDMPALTAPFVITTWLMLFGVYSFGHLQPTPLIAPVAVEPGAAVDTTLRSVPFGGAAGNSASNLANAVFSGIGEVMFQDNAWTGLVFLVAILVNSRISAAFAFAGSLLAMLTAMALGGAGVAIYHGLYGFNAVLTAIALGGLFLRLSWPSALYALVGAIFSTVAFAGLSVALSPIGMPALTAPFVITTWLFLLPKSAFRALEPVPMSEVTTPEQVRLAQTGRWRGPERGPAPGTQG